MVFPPLAKGLRFPFGPRSPHCRRGRARERAALDDASRSVAIRERSHVLGAFSARLENSAVCALRAIRGHFQLVWPGAFMTTNSIPLTPGVAGWREPLAKIEQLAIALRNDNSLAPERREMLEVEFVELQMNLPAAILDALRGRMRSGGRLVASVRRGQCTSCYTKIPRGDYPTLLAGRTPVFCHYCGVLLHADDEERLLSGAGGKR